MPLVTRVLDADPVTSFEAHRSRGGGAGLDAAVRMGGDAVLEEVEASGLRGRGGAGFPTGRKWRTVLENHTAGTPLDVVVNAAEGEPGSFKDRWILRRDPYRVLEGALIAARTLGADRVVIATKADFATEIAALRRAVDEVVSAGWAEGVRVQVVEGPSEYLFGEETGLLEVLAGRGPFPRVAPPYRRGVDDDEETSAEAQMAPPTGPGAGAPALVNNVETMAHVATILGNGPEWFRETGTAESPGTIVCTVSGDVRTAGVAEVPMGTPLGEVIDAIGEGARPKRRLVAAVSGVANPLIPAARFDTPLTYEDMVATGSGLGAAGFIVVDETTGLVDLVHGISRFLSVESCGQCTPCKQDGLAITGLLDRMRQGDVDEVLTTELGDRLATVTDGARCFLANQHQLVVDSLLSLFPDAVRSAAGRTRAGDGDEIRSPVLVAPIVDIVDGDAVLDERHAQKQPDWTYGDTWSGQSPADRIDTQQLED